MVNTRPEICQVQDLRPPCGPGRCFMGEKVDHNPFPRDPTGHDIQWLWELLCTPVFSSRINQRTLWRVIWVWTRPPNPFCPVADVQLTPRWCKRFDTRPSSLQKPSGCAGFLQVGQPFSPLLQWARNYLVPNWPVIMANINAVNMHREKLRDM